MVKAGKALHDMLDMLWNSMLEEVSLDSASYGKVVDTETGEDLVAYLRIKIGYSLDDMPRHEGWREGEWHDPEPEL